jgi:hypothetical protein
MHGGVSVLYSIWVTFESTNPQPRTPKDDSLSYIYNRTRGRCRRVLEHLFRAHSAEVLESIIDCWNNDVVVSSLIRLRDPVPQFSDRNLNQKLQEHLNW